MPVSNVPSLEFSPTGVVLPDETDILAGVLADMNEAFGGGLNIINLETPQGQLASTQAAVIADKNSEIAYIANQVDPQFADGRFQDGIARIYFLTRKPAVSTVVAVTVTGVEGTVIPAGTFAQDTSGNTYAILDDITIPALGTAYGTAYNLETGPIPCPIGTLTQVYQAINGWDTVTNESAGILGSDVETRNEFENRRKNSVALNAHGTPASIYAAVFNIPAVLDVYVIDNPEGTTVLAGATDYPLAPHSVYVAVVGGISEDIAQAIWDKKDVGCDYNGNTTVTVYDTSGYSYPYPQYDVTFMRPASLPILFAVQIVDDPGLPSDIVTRVKNAIIARFTGTDGSARERIGSTIYASKYYCVIGAAAANIAVISALVGTVTATLTSVAVGIDQSPTIDASNITVTLV